MVKQMPKVVWIMLLLALVSNTNAASWEGYVTTNNSNWHIYRTGANISADFSSYVEGTVAPIMRQGRSLSPYVSYFEDVAASDVRLKERTAAYQGNFKAEELTTLRSSISPVYYEIYKPAGTPVYKISFDEDWPASINSSRTLTYSGQNINDRGFAGNNLDFAGASFLYNKELSINQSANLRLKSMNATIWATDEDILNVDFEPFKDIDYILQSHSTGIADLKFKKSGPGFLVKPGVYETVAEGDERYVGTYDINRKIKMHGGRVNETYVQAWLPCCADGFSEIESRDRDELPVAFFDCNCPIPPLENYPPALDPSKLYTT